MSYRQKVLNKVKELDATLIERGDNVSGWDISIDTPPGFVWAGLGLHGVVAAQFNNYPPKKELWRALWEDIKNGLEPCDIEDCEYCLGL